MNLHGIENISDYVRYLQENPRETQFLFKDFLIGVTQFFRDPEAFEELKKTLLKYLQRSSRKAALFGHGFPGAEPGRKPIRWPSRSWNVWMN